MFTWKYKEQAPSEFHEQFPEFLPLVVNLLWQRGLRTQKEVDEFFNPDYEQDLHDPFLLRDIQRSIERIAHAIKKGERIVVYGDYDADGVCGATILISTIRELGGEDFPVSVYIPDRAKEGYGLNEAAIDDFAKENTRLLITVDCGTTNPREIIHAQKNGMDVIVTDHHQVMEERSPAFAFINPHQKEDLYPFKHLAGTGVAFKLVQALLRYMRAKGSDTPHEGWEKWLLDLVALATVTDVMPLLGENRTIVRYGLYVLAHSRRLGLNELMRLAGTSPTIDRETRTTNLNPFTLGFVLGPRLNATGRMDHANISFGLLNAKSKEEARLLAVKVEEANRRRQEAVRRIIEEIEKSSEDFAAQPLIFLGSAKWPIGVLGIAAAKLMEKYYKPVFLYQEREDVLAGSARSIPEFNVVSAMSYAKEYLLKFGGHPQAGGFSAKKEKAAQLKEALSGYAQKVFMDMILAPALFIDAQVSESDLNWNLIDELGKFQPFGEKNPQPVFVIEGMRVVSIQKIGKDKKHVRLRLKGGNGGEWKAIAFGAGERYDIPRHGDTLKIAFEFEADDWNGERELSMRIRDYAPMAL